MIGSLRPLARYFIGREAARPPLYPAGMAELADPES